MIFFGLAFFHSFAAAEETGLELFPVNILGREISFSEAWLIVFLIASLINYYFGRKRNEMIANRWAGILEAPLKESFTNIGEFEGDEYLK